MLEKIFFSGSIKVTKSTLIDKYFSFFNECSSVFEFSMTSKRTLLRTFKITIGTNKRNFFMDAIYMNFQSRLIASFV